MLTVVYTFRFKINLKHTKMESLGYILVALL